MGLSRALNKANAMFLIAYRTRKISLRVPALILQNVKRACSLLMYLITSMRFKFISKKMSDINSGDDTVRKSI